jgi:hypothetical protein
MKHHGDIDELYDLTISKILQQKMYAVGTATFCE